MMKRAAQRIRYVRTGDGVQLAWAEPAAAWYLPLGTKRKRADW